MAGGRHIGGRVGVGQTSARGVPLASKQAADLIAPRTVDVAADVVNIVHRHERTARHTPCTCKARDGRVDHPGIAQHAALGVPQNPSRPTAAVAHGHRAVVDQNACHGGVVGIARQHSQAVDVSARYGGIVKAHILHHGAVQLVKQTGIG